MDNPTVFCRGFPLIKHVFLAKRQLIRTYCNLTESYTKIFSLESNPLFCPESVSVFTFPGLQSFYPGPCYCIFSAADPVKGDFHQYLSFDWQGCQAQHAVCACSRCASPYICHLLNSLFILKTSGSLFECPYLFIFSLSQRCFWLRYWAVMGGHGSTTPGGRW